MREYYSGRRARTYDSVWAHYTAATHDAAYALTGFAVVGQTTRKVDWLWHTWALRLCAGTSSAYYRI